MTPPPRDPGWPSIGSALRSLWMVLAPGVRVRQFQESSARGSNSLTFLRLMFIQYALITLTIGGVLGCTFATIAYLCALPSKNNLAADQRELGRTGCERSLLAAPVGATAGDDG